jgi:pyrroloquinoline quinone biosynthesis protein B
MKLVVLKGGDEAIPLRATAAVARRNAGAVAVSLPGQAWVLMNVTPAVAEQLNSDARLLQHAGLVDPAVRAVVLTDAQVDHVTGLLGLRDGPPIHLYATPAVFEELTHNLPVLPLLEHYCGVHWHVIPVAGECREASFWVDGLPGIEFTAVATEEPLPPHASRFGNPAVGDSIALAVRELAGGQRFFCAGNLAAAGAIAVDWMNEADCVLVGGSADCGGDEAGDATIAQFGQVGARRKLLMCRTGEDLSDTASAPLGVARRAAHRAALASQGIELALDRMEILL